MAKRRRYLVCYDVRDDGRLRRVHSTVKGYGYPLQYSVFVCDLSDAEKVGLRWDVGEVMDFTAELPPVRRTGWLWGSCRGSGRVVGGFVVGGAEHLAVGVAAARVVPGFDPLLDGQGELLTGCPAVLVEQLELEGAEEAFGDGVVEAVTD